MEDSGFCAIGSTGGVSARNVDKGATCNNEMTGVTAAAALGPRAATAESTSEATTAGSEETAGCAPFETAATSGVRPGPGSVDAPAGWANSAERANAPQKEATTPTTSTNGLTRLWDRAGSSAWSSWILPTVGFLSRLDVLVAGEYATLGRQFGGPANSESSVTLRPSLARGLPFRLPNPTTPTHPPRHGCLANPDASALVCRRLSGSASWARASRRTRAAPPWRPRC
jgi:hypothetical protein